VAAAAGRGEIAPNKVPDSAAATAAAVVVLSLPE
jgi:hypothetical protein